MAETGFSTFDRTVLKNGMEGLVRTVLHALRRYVSEGELKDVVSSMPEDVRSLLQ